MSPSAAAREIANNFVMKHRSTFGEVDEKEISAAVNKVARAINDLQVAERRAQVTMGSNAPAPESEKRRNNEEPCQGK